MRGPVGAAHIMGMPIGIDVRDLSVDGAVLDAAFAIEFSGPSWSADLPGYEAMTILSDGGVLLTPDFPRI